MRKIEKRAVVCLALAILLASLVLIVGVLHGYFQDRVTRELESYGDCDIIELWEEPA